MAWGGHRPSAFFGSGRVSASADEEAQSCGSYQPGAHPAVGRSPLKKVLLAGHCGSVATAAPLAKSFESFLLD